MTSDPQDLKPTDVPTLTGDDLNRAVEWWVYGDDLPVTPQPSGVSWLNPAIGAECLLTIDGDWVRCIKCADGTWRSRARPFATDANLCLAFWEPGGVLRFFCDLPRLKDRPVAEDDGRTRPDEWECETSDGETFQEAACRAAVLVGMRRKAT